MKIKGLDYNTQRERIVLPEYGREVQLMVEHAMTIKNRARRQRCAETIVTIMNRMFPEHREAKDHERKLWDQLAIMSGFQLDIDYPFDVTQAARIAQKPKPMPYPMKRIPVRHYGLLVFELFAKLKAMPPGRQRDRLTKLCANQMRRDLMQWSHGSSDEKKVADDLARFTDGKIQLDLRKFKFERIVLHDAPPARNNGNNNNNNRKRR